MEEKNNDKSKRGYPQEFNRLVRLLRKCEGCMFELQEAFNHSKQNPDDKVYLSLGYDEDNQPHVGIKVYDKDGKWLIG